MANDQMIHDSAQAILDLALARLRDDRVTDPNVRHDLEQIAFHAKGVQEIVVDRETKWCANCVFAAHVHYEEGGKLVAPGCPGFAPKVTP